MRFLSSCLLVQILMWFPVSASVRGTDYFWATPTSEFFHQTSSWTPLGIPGSGDRTIFDLQTTDPLNRYGVYFTRDADIRAAQVLTDALAFVPGDNLVTLTDAEFGLEVARESGEVGNLAIHPDSFDRRGTVKVLNNARIGAFHGSDGILAVSSRLEVDKDLTVGQEGKGFFQTSGQGSSTISGDLIAGSASSGNGTILVVDPGARLDVDGTLLVGAAGKAILNVRNEGILNAENVELGKLAEAEGGVLINNGSTVLNVSGTLRVGSAGLGQIIVAEQAHAMAASVELGSSVGGIGYVNVTNAGTTFESENLKLGVQGLTEFVVDDGANTTFSNVAIGLEEGSEGVLRAWDSGSLITIDEPASVGLDGVGWLGVRRGASLVTNRLTLGVEETSLGGIQAENPGSTLDILGDLIMGVRGKAMIHIVRGARLNVGGHMTLGVESTANSTIELASVETQLVVAEDVIVGDSGSANVRIMSGARLTSRNVKIGHLGTANCTVEILDEHSEWSVQGNLDVGTEESLTEVDSKFSLFDSASTSVTGTTTIHPTGKLNIQDGTFSSDNLLVAGKLMVHGQVHAKVAGSGFVEVSQTATLGDATSPEGFTFSGDLLVGSLSMIEVGENTGSTMALPAELTLHDSNQVVFESGIVSLVNDSTLTTTHGLVLLPGAELQVQAGPTQTFLPELLDVLGNGTVNGPVQNQGTIRGPNDETQRLVFNDAIDGGGTFTGWIEMRGRVEPGVGIGTMLVENLELMPTASLNLEIGGATPALHDQVDATGQVTLGGELRVSLMESGGEMYVPALGDQFDLLSASELVGSFDTWTLPTLELGLGWVLLQTEASLSLSVQHASADFDQNQSVDGADFLAWQRGLGIQGTALHADGDANGDRRVSAADLAEWREQFDSAASFATVPEPTTVCLLAIALAVRHQRRTG